MMVCNSLERGRRVCSIICRATSTPMQRIVCLSWAGSSDGCFLRSSSSLSLPSSFCISFCPLQVQWFYIPREVDKSLVKLLSQREILYSTEMQDTGLATIKAKVSPGPLNSCYEMITLLTWEDTCRVMLLESIARVKLVHIKTDRRYQNVRRLGYCANTCDWMAILISSHALLITISACPHAASFLWAAGPFWITTI